MHERFRFNNREELIAKSAALDFELPYQEDISVLFTPVQINDHIKVDNRFVVQPMEGYDSTPDGSPGELTRRRYLRYAGGGSGMIWVEAVSVSEEGRSNPSQLWLHSENLDKYKAFSNEIKYNAITLNKNPLLVLQLTHSGRYSKPEGKAAPLVPQLNPVLDNGIPHILTDDELKKIQDKFIATAQMAKLAGFDAVDIKSCHGYLIHELLSSRNRKDSIYGGPDPSGRFRFLLETADRVKSEVPGIMVTVRLNVYDAIKGGFGMGKDESVPDFSEPAMLISELKQRGISLINITMGSPYYNPHVVRPFDSPIPGTKPPDEHPLTGVKRIIEGTSELQHKFPDLKIVGSAYSYLRHYAPNVAAAIIERKDASLIGFGRNSFAYPSMPDDLMEKGYADPDKICIGCSGCSRLIKNLYRGGCVIRDREIYGAELKKLIADGK